MSVYQALLMQHRSVVFEQRDGQWMGRIAITQLHAVRRTASV